MGKREIQIQRKKRYFIDACKKRIHLNGVDGLTVKEISRDAGYATGTLYNYFKSLNVLLFHCVKDYFNDLYDYLSKIECVDDHYDDYILMLMESYASFFIEKPEVYDLIYLKDLGSLEDLSGGENFRPPITQLLMEALTEYYEFKKIEISKKDLLMKGRLITNILHGNLLFFINNKSNLSSSDLKTKIKEEVLHVLSYVD